MFSLEVRTHNFMMWLCFLKQANYWKWKLYASSSIPRHDGKMNRKNVFIGKSEEGEKVFLDESSKEIKKYLENFWIKCKEEQILGWIWCGWGEAVVVIILFRRKNRNQTKKKVCFAVALKSKVLQQISEQNSNFYECGCSTKTCCQGMLIGEMFRNFTQAKLVKCSNNKSS